MHTNGPCNCLRPLPVEDRIGVQKRIGDLQSQLEAKTAECERLAGNLDNIVNRDPYRYESDTDSVLIRVKLVDIEKARQALQDTGGDDDEC